MSKETQYLVNVMFSSLTNSSEMRKEAKKYEEDVAAHFASLKNSQSK